MFGFFDAKAYHICACDRTDPRGCQRSYPFQEFEILDCLGHSEQLFTARLLKTVCKNFDIIKSVLRFPYYLIDLSIRSITVICWQCSVEESYTVHSTTPWHTRDCLASHWLGRTVLYKWQLYQHEHSTIFHIFIPTIPQQPKHQLRQKVALQRHCFIALNF